jgi:hypothetical protein
MTSPFPCPLCQRHTPDTGLLCAPCLQRLADNLHDVQRETELLSAVPSMAQPTGSRGGTLASHRAPARIDAIALADTRPNTDSTLGVLTAWARVVREDRRLTWPEHPDLTTERRTLTRHLNWIAAQPWVDAMAADLADLLARLRRTNPTNRPRPLGRCPAPDCNGPIWREAQRHVMWRHEGDRCTAHAIELHDGPAYCARCRQRWEGPDMARLALILERQEREATRPRTADGRPMLTADELARDHGVTVNAIRLRLSRAGARATSGHYDPDALTPSKASA